MGMMAFLIREKQAKASGHIIEIGTSFDGLLGAAF
jgi:hypothetical protein